MCACYAELQYKNINWLCKKKRYTRKVRAYVVVSEHTLFPMYMTDFSRYFTKALHEFYLFLSMVLVVWS